MTFLLIGWLLCHPFLLADQSFIASESIQSSESELCSLSSGGWNTGHYARSISSSSSSWAPSISTPMHAALSRMPSLGQMGPVSMGNLSVSSAGLSLSSRSGDVQFAGSLNLTSSIAGMTVVCAIVSMAITL